MEFNFLENNDPNKQSGKQPENFSFSFDQNAAGQNQQESTNEGSDDSFNFLNDASSPSPDPDESISDNNMDETQQESAPVFEESEADDEILTFAEEDVSTEPSDEDPFDFLSASADSSAMANEVPAEPASDGGFDFNFAANASPSEEVPAEPASDGGFDFNFAANASPSEEVPAEPASDGGFDFNFAANASPSEEVPAEPASDGGFDFNFAANASPSEEVPAEPVSDGGFDFNFAANASPSEEVPAEPASDGGFDFNFAANASPSEEVSAEPVSDGGFDFNFAANASPSEEVPAEPASDGGFDFNFAANASPSEEVPAEETTPDFISDDVVEDIGFAPTEESDGFDSSDGFESNETAPEPVGDRVDNGLETVAADIPVAENAVYMFSSENNPVNPVPSTDGGFNKRVRTPDTGAEYNLCDLIDVETGLPLDLSCFQQPSSAGSNADADVYGLAAAPAAGGFSMTSEGSGDSGMETAPARRRRAPKPVKKSKNALVELIKIVLGAVAGIVIAMYLAVLIAPMIGKGESNIPVPLPGLPQTYKHIPKDFPESMMWLFPGRAADSQVTVDDNQSEGVSSDKENLDVKDDIEGSSSDNLEDDPAFNTDFLNEGKKDKADKAEAKADQSEEDAGAEESANSDLGFDNPPTITDDQLKAEVGKVAKAFVAAGKTIDPSVCKALGDMALSATFAELNAGSMGKVQKAMENMAGKLPGAPEMLGKSLNERLNDMEDEGGFIAVGTISEKVVRSGYKIAIIQVEGVDGSKDQSSDGLDGGLEDKGANGLVVEFVGTKEIDPQEGDRVVFSGKILTNPAAQLKDFEPGREPSLWGGIILVNSAKPAPIKEKAPATEAASATEEASPAAEEASPAAEEASPAAEEASPAAEEASPAAEEASPAAEEASPAAEEASPAAEEASPAAEEASPAAEEASPAAEEQK